MCSKRCFVTALLPTPVYKFLQWTEQFRFRLCSSNSYPVLIQCLKSQAKHPYNCLISNPLWWCTKENLKSCVTVKILINLDSTIYPSQSHAIKFFNAIFPIFFTSFSQNFDQNAHDQRKMLRISKYDVKKSSCRKRLSELEN